MADEKKKPETKPEPIGVAVFITPKGGGKFKVESFTTQGGKTLKSVKTLEKDNPRVALSFAMTLLEDAASKEMK